MFQPNVEVVTTSSRDGSIPTRPQDLTRHSCIPIRLQSARGFHAWELEKRGREVRARVDGQVVIDGIDALAENDIGDPRGSPIRSG